MEAAPDLTVDSLMQDDLEARAAARRLAEARDPDGASHTAAKLQSPVSQTRESLFGREPFNGHEVGFGDASGIHEALGGA